MGTGYTRNDTSGNIANGKVIDATDLDGEFDAIVTAFSTSGHTHDGTAAEGGKVTKLLGTSLTLGDGTAGTDITVTFDGETQDGVLIWMEDEDYFKFNDDILMNTSEKLQFRDTGIYISSNADGDLDIVSDGTAVDSINIESAGGITLDAGTAGSGIIYEDDGTEMMRIYNSSSDVVFQAKVDAKDLVFQQYDGNEVMRIADNRRVYFYDEGGEYISSDGTDFTFASGNDINLTATTDNNIPAKVGLPCGHEGEKIEGDGTNLTIASSNNLTIDATGDIILDADGDDITLKNGSATFASFTNSSGELVIKSGSTPTTAMTFSGANVTFAGTVTIGSAGISEAELEILDGATVTTTELNILDGDTSASSTTVADADRVVLNDGGTMKQVAVTDLSAYFDDEITAMPNLTSVGTLTTLTVDNVIVNGTTIGHTDDTDLITLADGVVTVAGELDATTLDISGNADIDGTLEADAITVDGTALNEYIQDTVGAMFSSNTETNITVTYQDGDGTIDLVASTGAVTTGTNNFAIGTDTLDNMSTGSGNTAFGIETLNTMVNGSQSTAVGYQALSSQTSGSDTNFRNTAVGYHAGKEITSGGANTLIGALAGDSVTTGANNVVVGQSTFTVNAVASGNVAIGDLVLGVFTNGGTSASTQNTAVGMYAGNSLQSGSNNLFLGKESGLTGSPGGAQTTGSNEIFLGDENITASNIQVDWTVASDERDKTDFTALDVGLSFVNSLKPYTYKWDKRIKYVDKTKEDWNKDLDLDTITHDGTHKEDWLDIGFKAQEVEALEKDAGYKIADKTNLTTSLSSDGKQYGIKYSNFVPILVKALQELSAKNDALEARIKTLEG